MPGRAPLDPDSWRRIGAVLDRVSAVDVRMQPDALAEACRAEGIAATEVEPYLAAERDAADLPEQIAPAILDEALRGLADVGAAHSLKAGDRLGPYEIVAPLGAGGMGEVYAARDARLARTVALKRLHADLAAQPDGRRRFEREARAISALNHPHICTLFDVGEQDGIAFLVMELVEGETLATRLRRGRLSVAETVRHAAQMADALAAAHRQGVVHRDLKPANVMLTPHGVKLLDFGLAALRTPDASDDDSVATAKGALLGTPAYMAPEQVHGRSADARADIFALGTVIHEMLTGHRAFEGTSSAAVIAAILERDPEPLTKHRADVPEALAWTVRTCLAKDADERWQNAADVARQLQWSAATPVADQTAVARPVRSHTTLWIAGAILIAAGAVAAIGLSPRVASPAGQPALARFALTPPAGHSYDRLHALSPDASRLAFVTSDEKGQRALWTRALDALAPLRLAGTEDASYPFWSPDARFIGFFANNALKKVELATGAVEVVCNCDTGTGGGGTWNRDGVILFSKGLVVSPLWRVPASGGRAEPVAPLVADGPPDGDVIDLVGTNAWPQFLPDGRHFLWLSGAQHASGLFLGTINSPDRKRILEFTSGSPTERSRGWYSGGYLFFVRQQSVMAQRFSTDRMELSGDPIRIVESVEQTAPGRSLFDVSAGVLTYRPNLDERPMVRLAWFDRSGRETGTLGDPMPFNGIALSRDGRYAMASTPTTGLVRIDTASGIPTPVDLRGQSPAWSPDGKHFALAGGRGRRPAPLPAIAGVDDAHDVQRVDVRLLGGQAWPTDWSSDGRYVLGQVLNAETALDLWAVDVQANPMTMRYLIKAPGDQQDQRTSPDGHWVAYASNERSDTFEVYVRPFPEGPGGWRVSTSGGRLPTWTADGRELLYVAPDGALMRVAVAAGKAFSASAPQLLFQHDALRRGFNRHAQFGRPYDIVDGRRILMGVPISVPPPAPLVVVLNWQQLIGKTSDR
jgi:hypothetical protein